MRARGVVQSASLWMRGATRHFNSGDLEDGNASKGLTGGLGDGSGDWRIELVTDLDIEPSAYIRTPDGFLTAMHAVARADDLGGASVHRVPIFNPGRNPNQVSWLRVANLTGQTVAAGIEARDDAGQMAPEGLVLLPLLPYEARTISARQLESGDFGFGGRLGAGTGKWQLFVVTDAAIEVVSLLQSPTDHLSNLSTMPRDIGADRDFEVVAEGPSIVRPLQTIHLTVPDGLGESNYTVLMDLSGTGAFAADETIEAQGLSTSDDHILFASPLAQMLSEANSLNRLAVQVRRETDQALSGILQFTIADISIAAELPGFSTTLLEVVLKSIYTSSGDPLLTLEAASMHPGSWMYSARQLGLDTASADVQAEAVLQSLFDMPVTEVAPDPRAPASAAVPRSGHVSRASTGAFDTRTSEGETSLACKAVDLASNQGALCNRVTNAVACAREYNEIYDAAAGRGGVDDFNDMTLCIGNAFRDFSLRDAARNSLKNAVGGAVGAMFKKGATVLARSLSRKGEKAIEVAGDAVAAYNNLVPVLKLAQSESGDGGSGGSDSSRHYVRNESGELDPTSRGRSSSFDNLRTVGETMSQLSADHITQAERDFGEVELDDSEREGFWSIVNQADHQRSDAEAIGRREDVYTGGANPIDAIRDDPALSRSVASGCEAGYEEFVVDENTSTCVFHSLVEDNCYAGSRRSIEVNLGNSDACLYYSLDFIQPGDSCRQNYARVFLRGRWTCRWAELSVDQPHVYTVNKGHGADTPEGPETIPPGEPNAVAGSPHTISAPEGLSATGYTVNNVPAPPGNPPSPPSPGQAGDGCDGDRDSGGNRIGRWVCVYSGRVSFDTYQAGTLHGPSGSYDSQGRPDGSFGSYENGNRAGVWSYFSAYSGRVSFDTYRAGTLHGSSGSYDSQGRPDGSFGSYENGDRNGVWLYFSAYSGRVSFDTYRAGTLHGPSGSYDSQGRPDGSFGNYENGDRNGVWFYFSAYSGRVSFDTYQAGTLHGPTGAFNAEGERDGSFGSYANGSRTGTWTYYDDGVPTGTTDY